MIKYKNKVLLCKRREDMLNALPNYWSVNTGYVEAEEGIKEASYS